MNENWMSISEASTELEVSISLIASLIRKGMIEVHEDPVDGRIKVVNVEEIREILKRSVRGRKKS